MSLISLKNVSKFYFSKGVIASGFNKVNLELNDGEFVAITGESGSGKSTLLNVISGLDTYEEGEMYINGEETSHYSEKDFEDYRRKYIGNIFQSFNLVNSYTVYQNIELVLLLNGNKKKNIKKNVLELIKKVGLYKFRNTKVSKLSGGMKQRVAIARALAKETPIIIADEPTGNLDSSSAKDVLKLLSDISKDKLVIIVTHNYDQIEEYVTRKITMHDGKITEDKKIKNIEKYDDIKASNYKNITLLNKIRIGIRNAFNIKVKFLLLLFVYAFVVFAICFEYSSFKDDEYIMQRTGQNDYILDSTDKRIIISKKNKDTFTDDDFNKIAKLENVENIIKNDILTDTEVFLVSPKLDIFVGGYVRSISSFDGNLDHGRMPTNDNELIVVASKDDYYLNDRYEDVLNADMYMDDVSYIDKSNTYKIVGIMYNDNVLMNGNYIYVTDNFLKHDEALLNMQLSDKKIKFNETFIPIERYTYDKFIVPSSNVKDGEIILSNNHNIYCKYDNCLNKTITVNVKNGYYEEEKNFKVTKVYNKYNFKRITGLSDYETHGYAILISNNDYNLLFNKGIYQSSIYVKNAKKVDDTALELKNLDYKTFVVKDHLNMDEPLQYLQIIKTFLTAILIIVLFVISYFVTKVILKSRQIYFSTIRMLGSNKKVCKKLLSIELLVISNIAYLLFLSSLILTKFNVIKLSQFKLILDYFGIYEMIGLYILINLMSYLISIKYSKKIFKKSVINTLKEDN